MRLLYIFFLLLLANQVLAQDTIPVVELDILLGKKQDTTRYFAFEKGDKVLLEISSKKRISNMYFQPYKGNPSFQQRKRKGNIKRIVSIPSTQVYGVTFQNLTRRKSSFQLKISRIPGRHCNPNFNTTVDWQIAPDTTFKVIPYKKLVKTDTLIDVIANATAVVHSKWNSAKNKEYLTYVVPDNAYRVTYYIGVNQAGAQAFEKAKNKFFRATSKVARAIPNYGVLASFALDGISYFSDITSGKQDVQYYFVRTYADAVNFKRGEAFREFKKGNVVFDYGYFENPTVGKRYLCLKNHNKVQPIDVFVRMEAIRLVPRYEVVQVKKVVSIRSIKQPIVGQQN